MGRVLPFIFVTTGLVALAVFQAQLDRAPDREIPLAMADPVTVESLAHAVHR